MKKGIGLRAQGLGLALVLGVMAAGGERLYKVRASFGSCWTYVITVLLRDSRAVCDVISLLHSVAWDTNECEPVWEILRRHVSCVI